jgi:hypothetical protein
MKKFGFYMLLLALACGNVSRAEAAVFSFTFTGNISNGFFEPGTVTGLIFGLSENGLNQTPTGSEIISSALDGANNLSLNYGFGTFDVVDGTITGANGPNSHLGVFFGSPDAQQTTTALLEFNRVLDGSNRFDCITCNDGTGGGVENTAGFAGVTYSEVSAVPEPSTWALMFLGFCGIGAMTYRRRKSAMLAA